MGYYFRMGSESFSRNVLLRLRRKILILSRSLTEHSRLKTVLLRGTRKTKKPSESENV